MYSKARRCANDIMDFLKNHGLTEGVCIYVDGKRYRRDGGIWVVEDNMDPHDYFEYAGDFLSMSFEGPLYDVLNYYYSAKYCDEITSKFNELLKKHGKYFEMGNAWNLSLYDL